MPSLARSRIGSKGRAAAEMKGVAMDPLFSVIVLPLTLVSCEPPGHEASRDSGTEGMLILP
jgi:hypothetical protein